MQILTNDQQALFNRERALLGELQIALTRFGMERDDEAALRQAVQQMYDLFLLVVAGEFNSGKSTFINALLGQRLLKEGVTPTTTQINILRHGESESAAVLEGNILALTAPSELLREISIVDTPGTNAILREHEAITAHFIPRSDLVLFVTSAERPFTESERGFLEQIRDWGKKIVVVLNKIDILQSDADIQEVERFITENAARLLGIQPQIFPVSARLAMLAKAGDPRAWGPSRFEPLENYIRTALDEDERLRLKLSSPLGVGQRLTGRYTSLIHSRLDLLKEDTVMLDEVEAQLGLYQEDMRRDFKFRMADIENVLLDMEKRGDDYFESTLRLGRVSDLINKKRIQQEFEQQVVADVPGQIERKVNDLIDWLVEADLRQWQSITGHLAERRRKLKDRLIGDDGVGSFQYDRERLMDALGRESGRVVETYDRAREAEEMALAAQTAVAATAAIEVSAVGLGALVAALATTLTTDITGILLASLVAVLGLFVIPIRKRNAKRDLSEKIAALRKSLVGALEHQFSNEMERSIERIRAAIAPYSRFVRMENEKLSAAGAELAALEQQLADLKHKVENL